MKIKIQKFKKEQVKEVCKLIIKSFNEFVAPSFSKKGKDKYLSQINSENILKKYNSKKRKYFSAIYNDRIIGIMEIKKHGVSWLFVNKKFHRKGIGRNLMAKAELILKKKEVEAIKINSSIYAIKFYEKIGYKKSRGIVKKQGMVVQPMKKIL